MGYDACRIMARGDRTEHALLCDGSGCVAEISVMTDLAELVDRAQEAGWRFRKLRGEWRHYCPACPAPDVDPGSARRP